MADESEDLKNLWQSQPSDPSGIRLGDFRQKMRKFERRIFWRNVREYAAGAVVVAVFTRYEWKFHGLLVRLGSGLIIAGTLYVMYQLHRRASLRPAPADMGLSPCIEYHRKALERQRDALQTIWSWYLFPFVPGLMVFVLGSILNRWATHPGNLGHLVLNSLGPPAIMAAVFVVAWWLNRKAAARLQAQIDELSDLSDGGDSRP